MAAAPSRAIPQPNVPELHSGDRLTREEFHRIYAQLPPGFKAELVGGVVHVPSPLALPHGTNHLPLGTLFFVYEGDTPGVESGDNTTILLGQRGEPQPDLFLRILPEFGGQSGTTADQFVLGAPELLSEIAHSSRAIDLFTKREDFTRYGVLEYLVLCLEDRQLRWFDLKAGIELQADPDGVFRMRTFPGLWINGPALLERNPRAMLATLDQGLATPEHAEFVRKLAANRTK